MDYFLQFVNQIEAIQMFYGCLEHFQCLEYCIPMFRTIYLGSVFFFFLLRESLVNASFHSYL